MASSDGQEHYGVLGIASDATKDVIKKAFRKLAPKWHPDKNKSPNAADTFMKIQLAYEVLSDDKAREAYDALWKHQLRKRHRDEQHGQRHQQLKNDLRAKERAAQADREAEYHAKHLYDIEVERLRQEGFKRQKLDAEQRMQEHVTEAAKVTEDDKTRIVRAKWKAKGGILAGEQLRLMCTQFGKVLEVIMGEKGSSAMIYFEQPGSAHAAIVKGELQEEGFRIKLNPLKGQSQQGKVAEHTVEEERRQEEPERTIPVPAEAPSLSRLHAYESETLERLRQAAKRGR